MFLGDQRPQGCIACERDIADETVCATFDWISWRVVTACSRARLSKRLSRRGSSGENLREAAVFHTAWQITNLPYIV